MLAMLTVTTDQDVVDLTDGKLSLREAIFVANTAPGADEIEFDFGHDGPATILLTQGELTITDSLTIEGAGAGLLTIDASGNDPTPEANNGDGSRVFLIDDGVKNNRLTAEIRGMTLTGGDTSDRRGGAIHSREHLTVAECVITGNAVQALPAQTGGWGGGIQTLYANLIVVDTTIKGNTATTSGGGIDFNPVGFDVELTVTNSIIEDNYAGVEGGGILIAGNATITGTSIFLNDAPLQGGGISVWQLADEATIRIENSDIVRNEAALGGGIYSDAAPTMLEIVGTIVSENRASEGGGVWMVRTGFPLSADEFPLVVERSEINGNMGGGLKLAGVENLGKGMAARISDSEISSNWRNDAALIPGPGLVAFVERLAISQTEIADNEGVGLQVRGNLTLNSTFSLVDSQVARNTTGLYVRDMATTLQNTTITGNLGRGIDKRNGTLAMAGGSASGNMGDGLYSAVGNVSITDAVLNSNKGRGADVRTATLTVIGSRFEHNETIQSGAGIYLQNGSLSVMSSIVNHNTSGQSGGGIRHNGVTGQTVTITGSEISENVAGSFGGGIDSSANLLLTDSEVIGNRASGLGGGIRAQRELTIIRSAVSENRTLITNSPGGGFSATGNVMIVDSSVSKNRTFGSNSPGGGAHSASGTMTVLRSNISGNSTESNGARGGGISGSTVSIVDSTISGNFTTGSNSSGGGVSGGTITILQSTISSNSTLGSSAHGAGAWAGARMTVQDSTVTKNEAEHILAMGGGLMVADGPLTLGNSIVAQNFASAGADSDLKVQTTLTASYTLLGSLNTLNPPQTAAFTSGPGNVPIANPMLSPLDYFGGPEYRDGTRLETHVPLAGSPVIDMGDPAAPTGPIALYRFGEAPGATTIVDAIGGLDGAYVGGPTLGVEGAPATSSSAVDFDGLDDYATVPASVESDFSFSLWVKTSQPSAGGVRIGLVDGAVPLPNDFGLYIQSGRPLFLVSSAGISSTDPINDGNWHHVAATRSAATGARNLYVDGVLRGSAASGPTGVMGDADSWRIGGLQAGGGLLDGAMDELAVFDRVLSAAEVLQQVSAGPLRFDQRGEPFDRIVGGRIDIGAVESQSVTFVVDTLVDESDGNYSAGDFSLREAIELANVNSGKDAIEFDPALTASGPAKILLTTMGDESLNGRAALLITDGVSILGPGADLLTLDASGIDPTPNEDNGDGGRVLTIYDATDSSSMETLIRGLTITGGDVGFNGSLNANGGGINAHFMRLLLQESTVTGNHAEGLGGGVYVNSYHQPGPSLIERSTVTSNHAGFSGGGVAIRAGEAFGTIVRESLIANNRGGYRGGGIHVTLSQLDDVPFILENSTVSGNVAFGGGGIGFGNDTNHAFIRYSTITQNSSIGPDGGGGVLGSRGEATLSHVIIAGNQDAAGLASDLVRGPTEFGIPSTFALRNSLIGANNDSGYAEAPVGMPDANGNLIGGIINGIIVPGLSPLANNGGPTKTHALLPGSPAIDAGDPMAVAGVNGVPQFDQRGMPWVRVANGDDVPEARIDMGAVEWQANPLGGDYNFNGVVDAADYSVWQDTLGSPNDLRADGSSATTPGAPDGVVDEHDYAWWKTNFGNVLMAGQGAGGRPAAQVSRQGDTSVESAETTIEHAHQPPALPGVASVFGAYLMASSASELDAELPPAEPGAEGRVRESSLNREAALMAWEAQQRENRPNEDGAGIALDDLTAVDGDWESIDEVFAELEFALPGGGA